MTKIKILPKIITSKIAAGEIIQRPASVVKELIENSIDAKSNKITIEINEGGKSLIRVSDDGIGMSKEDALLSLERYATSKIKNDNDLFLIKSLGFRGEAIPSIASISKFSIITREHHDNISTKVKVEGGKVKDISNCGSPYGSIVTVKDLFFNIPVRKKFLKSISTETNRISDIVIAMAISKPKIRFKLLHNSKIVKDFLDFNDPINRINDVLGGNLIKHLLPLELKSSSISVKGWIGTYDLSRSSSKSIYFFINGRYIKNKAIMRSLTYAYKEKIAKGRYPVAFIFIKLPYDQIDVNIHPTKREVRLLNQNKVSNSLHSLINITLLEMNRLKSKHSGLLIDYVEPKLKKSNDLNPNPFKIIKIALSRESKKNNHFFEEFFYDLTIIGQYCNTYIICSYGKDLILIDQHAAHELILFEQLKLINNCDKKIISQSLVVSKLIEINLNEAYILRKLIPHFKKYDLRIKPFGETTFIVEAIPIPIKSSEICMLIKKLIREVSETAAHETNIQSTMCTCLSKIACHSAIKAQQNLTNQEIENIIHQLDIYKNSSYYPHGKRIWIKICFSDLIKKFNISK